MMEKGAYELLTAIRKYKNSNDQDRQLAWDLYIQIITLGFEWQRNGTVANLSRREDEEIKEHMDQDRPFLSRDDYEKIIETLRNQMLTAAKNQEFSRAELYRKRIDELSAEMNKVPHEHTLEVTVNQ